MSSIPDVRLTRIWPAASPWRLGVVSTLLVGGLGSLSLLAGAATGGAEPHRMYVSAIANWTNACAIGYILGVARYGLVGLRKDLERLGPLLYEAPSTLYLKLTAPGHPLALVVITVLGVTVGVLLSAGDLFRLLSGDRSVRLFAWTVLLLPLLWTLILQAFWLMLGVAIAMFRIGRNGVRIDLRDPSRLDAFANAGFRHMLLIVIGLTVIPVQAILTGEIDAWDFVPALSVSLPVAFALLLLPLLGAHQGIVAAKHSALAGVDAETDAAPADTDRALLLRLYRGELARTAEWPLSVGGIARVVSYALLPPLAWTAAALIETLVSNVIG